MKAVWWKEVGAAREGYAGSGSYIRARWGNRSRAAEVFGEKWREVAEDEEYVGLEDEYRR
ncbi:MAG TPA: hypothetical protein VFI90_06810 [Rubrobacter sp.]|nr:hypothetical protein [Rubrobacter sp.]